MDSSFNCLIPPTVFESSLEIILQLAVTLLFGGIRYLTADKAGGHRAPKKRVPATAAAAETWTPDASETLADVFKERAYNRPDDWTASRPTVLDASTGDSESEYSDDDDRDNVRGDDYDVDDVDDDDDDGGQHTSAGMTTAGIHRVCQLSTLLHSRDGYPYGLKCLINAEYCFGNGDAEKGMKYLLKFLLETDFDDMVVQTVRRLHADNIQRVTGPYDSVI